MAKDRLSRKLRVILHADVVGSTALVQQNETLAHERIQSVFNQFSRVIDSYGGKTRELRGDALVAEFERASDAVVAALAFQASNKEFNLTLGDDIRPNLRIGISLGEVIVADNTITGVGVVLAQRLEQLADPGGVVVQGSVSELVPDRIPIAYESLEEQILKGLNRPIRAFSVNLQTGAELPVPDANSEFQTARARDWRNPLHHSTEHYRPLIDELLELPDKPSIAVLPFQNMSEDPGQEQFADGITEDIITELSGIPDLIVIARNSTFVYKRRAVDVRKVGRELGVGYVLEGSVQKSGDRLRITSQLVDTQSGDHLWAERYDRNLDDVFAIQDEITREIVIALSVKLTYGEESRTWSEYTSNFQTWKLFQRGMAEQLKFTQEGHDQALRIAQRIQELEPDFPMAKVFIGWVLQSGARYGFIKDASVAVAEAERLVREVLADDDRNADAHTLLGYILVNRSMHEEAIAHGQLAIEFGPSVATNHATFAVSLFYVGEHAASLARMKKAIRLTSYPPDWYLAVLGDAYRSCGELEKARTVFEHLAVRMPRSIMSLTRLISAYSDLGENDLASQTADELMAVNPIFSVSAYMRAMPFKLDSDRESLCNALLCAGMLE